ncbi:MAG: carboxypeptidase regulatory-like domain-containing protein [Candidatus Magasanikbacteria bacterium]|nr:carboxypeptidase regulatory-like domain-containing protein [Candidatus Magasanikbacteria bacterium]
MVSGRCKWQLLIFLIGLFLAKPVFASTTDGTISTGNAWSANIGWIKFAATNGNVHVTDAGLTGHAWSDLYGWIKLNPTTSGVTNNGEGVLSGSAWGANIGWINFSGVTINSNGVFTGTATGDNTGAINFSCANCLVQTDWRPASARNTGQTNGGTAFPVSGSSGGGSIPSTTVATTTLPTSTITFPATTTPVVIKPIAPTVREVIEKVKEVIKPIITKIFPVEKLVPPLAKLYSEAKLWLPKWFRPPAIDNTIPIERFVAKNTPFVFKTPSIFLTPSVNRFVFAPLPKEFLALENKFPQVHNILQQVGVKRFTDIEKVKTAQLYLPGLTRTVAFDNPKIKTSEFGVEKAIPVGNLSDNTKDKLPANIVFARTAGQLVDFKIALSLTSKGRPEQKISTVSGKPLQLVMKPDFPAKSIKGYLVFRSQKPQVRAEMPLAGLVNSLLFAEPVFAHDQVQPVPVEEKLVLLEFDYTDPDGDGVYTADIQSPVPAGEYEIITVIEYQDPELGTKQIRLITVIDPEGYVYEKIGDKELRIPNAKVTIYNLNTESNSYEEWPAKDFQQENPQTTGLSGSYSFLVPGGMYYIQAEASGYKEYKSEPFSVDNGGGVHMNIELKSKYWWLKVLDWKTTMLFIVIMLLLFNFYRDYRRNKKQINNLINK